MKFTQHTARCATRQFLATAAALALAGGTTASHAQLLDSGYESGTLTTLANVLNNPFPANAGQWGAESGFIATSSTNNLFGPMMGNRMLAMTATPAGVSTQTVQAVDVSAPSFSTLINSAGGAKFTFSAYFNAERTGPIGGLLMQFFSGNTYGTALTPFYSTNVTVDANASGWQQGVLSAQIPGGTAWMLAQVYYLNASLASPVAGGLTGYVDGAELGITAVPEPASYAMLGSGLALLAAMVRRRRTGAD